MFFGSLTNNQQLAPTIVFQWFLVLQLPPALSMVFDGFGPLVKRCDGFDGSSWSMQTKGKVKECILEHANTNAMTTSAPTGFALSAAPHTVLLYPFVQLVQCTS